MKILRLPTAHRKLTKQEVLFQNARLEQEWDKAIESINLEYTKIVKDLKMYCLLSNLICIAVGILIGLLL